MYYGVKYKICMNFQDETYFKGVPFALSVPSIQFSRDVNHTTLLPEGFLGGRL